MSASAASLPEVLLLVFDRCLQGNKFDCQKCNVVHCTKYRLVTGYNLSFYYNNGDTAWFGLTLAFILMPGFLETLYWINQLKRINGELTLGMRKFWKWILFAVTFPVSILYK